MGVSFPLPAGWIGKPPSNSMRLAEADVPGPAGDATKACLVVFSTAGGSVDDNIARWAGQVRDPKGQPVAATPQKRTVAGLPVTVVEMTGSYAGMGGGEPQANYTLRAAIVEAPAGLIFIKMTGPAEQMSANAPAFNAMVDGLTKP
jgi:hypothetical protein